MAGPFRRSCPSSRLRSGWASARSARTSVTWTAGSSGVGRRARRTLGVQRLLCKGFFALAAQCRETVDPQPGPELARREQPAHPPGVLLRLPERGVGPCRRPPRRRRRRPARSTPGGCRPGRRPPLLQGRSRRRPAGRAVPPPRETRCRRAGAGGAARRRRRPAAPAGRPAEHPTQLRQRARLVGRGAEDPEAPGRVEDAVAEGQFLRNGDDRGKPNSRRLGPHRGRHRLGADRGSAPARPRASRAGRPRPRRRPAGECRARARAGRPATAARPRSRCHGSRRGRRTPARAPGPPPLVHPATVSNSASICLRYSSPRHAAVSRTPARPISAFTSAAAVSPTPGV